MNGVCIAPTIVKLASGQPWTGTAAEVVAAAGRRSIPGPLVAPVVSPPVNTTQNNLDTQTCQKFGALPCDKVLRAYVCCGILVERSLIDLMVGMEVESVAEVAADEWCDARRR